MTDKQINRWLRRQFSPVGWLLLVYYGLMTLLTSVTAAADAAMQSLWATAAGDFSGNIDHLIGVEIESHNSIVALGLQRFLLDTQAVAFGIEFGYTVTFGVAHPITKNRSLTIFIGRTHRFFKHACEACTMENIVAKNKACTVVAYKICANGKCLCKAIGRGLLGILETHAIVAAITQQTLESGQVLRCRDYKNLADTCEHQHRNGVIDHGLIEDGDKLLTHSFCYWIEACAATTCKYNSFHKNIFLKT